MPNIYDNGNLREMTAEEIAEIDRRLAEMAMPDPTEAMEAALNELGVETRE